jgi:hypothetical protein
MSVCKSCGNDYDKSFEVRLGGQSYTFDCFECAAHALAPTCANCGLRILGHGVEAQGVMFCSGNCARVQGHPELRDRV